MTSTASRGTPPLIGVTSYLGPASWRTWQEVPAAVVPRPYLDHVLAAGGIPVIIPPAAASTPEMHAVLTERLDGLMLVGGSDLDPALYGQQPHSLAQQPVPERDAAELALLAVMREQQRPVLGICRGVQVMTVAAGGRLIQHLPDVLGHENHSPTPGSYGQHDVTIAQESQLYSILGAASRVSSYHHQGLLDHPGYVATAWAPDGTVEAIEDRHVPFCIGVLWHPEVDADPRLFQALVVAAASRTD